MSRKYVIDASALIDANERYNMNKKLFMPIWDKISEMFKNKTLVSSIEIFDEVKDTELKEWLKSYKSNFLPLSEGIQRNVVTILKDFPNMINVNKKKSGSSNGDPFLVATAMSLKDSILVTNEKAGGFGAAKMPNVCQKYNIECINLIEFINRVVE